MTNYQVIPDSALATKPDSYFNLGKPVNIHTYRNKAGGPVVFVCRFETEHGKEFRPLRYQDGEWVWKNLDGLKLLYNLDQLAKYPDRPVMICEGEKACGAASKLFPDYVCITSMCGAMSPHKSDWSPLKGSKKIIVWADHDNAGQDYKNKIIDLLIESEVSENQLFFIDTYNSTKIIFEDGWDAADILENGLKPVDVEELIMPIFNNELSLIDEIKKIDLLDGATQKKTQATLLLEIGEMFELCHDGQGRRYAIVKDGRITKTLDMDSEQFKELLRHLFYELSGKGSNDNSIKDALTTLKAHAKFKGKRVTVYTRIAGIDGKIYIDLCDDDWKVIEIHDSGWRVLDQSAVLFVRNKSSKGLPTPEGDGRIDRLFDYINVEEKDQILVIGWILGCFQPEPAYPILILQGEQGSGKTTMMKILRMLIDPDKVVSISAPKKERDLAVSAQNHRLICFDNISSIPNWLSDAFCRMSTGGTISTRKLYTDTGESAVEISRPVLINGITEIVNRPDLLDRSITLELPSISGGKREPECELLKRFSKDHPAILGVICDLLACALRNISTVKIKEKPRLADFAQFVVAGTQDLKGDLDFLDCYRKNINDSVLINLYNSPIGSAIIKLMNVKNSWRGSATDLLSELMPLAESFEKKSWPSSASALSAVLSRLAVSLRQVGISLSRHRTGTSRVIELNKTGKLASLSS